VGRQVSTSDAIGRGGEDASRGGVSDAAPPGSRAYPNQLPTDWWRRNRRYFLYLIREFTAVPIAIWMIWFLVEIASARGGAAGYQPPGGVAFVAFSAACLVFALWHSFTFLRLSGLIVRIPLGQRTVPAPVIVVGSFALLLVASVVVGGLLVWGGR
jgi:succinate dehydrogenase subunit C